MATAIGDFNVCYEAACSFLRVAEWCDGEDEIHFLSGGMYPFSVNIAFANELFIKAILIHNSSNDEFTKGHNLKDLFGILPQSDQVAITSTYNAKCSEDLSTLLNENGDAFVDWRYALEREVSICIKGMLALAQALKEYIDSIK